MIGEIVMMSGEKPDGLPTWAKVLIGIVVIGMLGVAGVVGAGIYFVSKMSNEATDPQAIARTAAQVATFQEPLPAGYKFVMGIGLAGYNLVTAEHEPEEQTIILISYPVKQKESAQEILDRMFDSGLSAGSVNAQFSGEKTKGEMGVAGQSMPYVLSTVTDGSGKDFKGLLGCIQVPDKNKTVLVYGMQPEGDTYKLEITEGFLKAVKKF